MRVGVVLQDPRRAPTGLDVYTENLWRALGGLDGEIELVPVTLPFGWAARSYLRVLWEQIFLPLWALRRRVDLLHIPAGSVPILWRRPCVMTLHDLGQPAAAGYGSSAGPRLFFGRVVPASARFASAIMADSEATKRDAVEQFGIPEERISVVPLAADPAFQKLDRKAVSEARAKYDLTRPYFLQVGAPVPRKNLAGALAGFARFAARNPEARVDFVAVGGDGNSLPEVPAEAAALLDQGRIHRLGFVPREDLVALYNGAMAVVVPSFYEGFGLPLVEAFACGTPAISSTAASLPEVGGSAALYIDPNKPDTIADAMEQFTQPAAFRSKMRQRARRRAKHFSWELVAEKTHALYKAVLDGKTSTAGADDDAIEERPKVLFVRLDKLGDVVLTTPCFEAVKRRYPSARVDVITQPATAPVLEDSRFVDRVFTLDAPWHGRWRPGAFADVARAVRRLRREQYDFVITPRRDLDDALFARACGGTRTLGFYSHRTRPFLSDWVRFDPGLHTVDNHLRLTSLLGCEKDGLYPEVVCTAGDSDVAGALKARAREKRPLVALAPFASADQKTLDDSTTSSLLDELNALGLRIALIGGPGDRARADGALTGTAAPVTDLVGQTTIAELCDVLRRCALVVCVDSAPMHLAAALGVPTVALFTNEDPTLWGPYGEAPHRVVQMDTDAAGDAETALLEERVRAAVDELLRLDARDAKSQPERMEMAA